MDTVRRRIIVQCGENKRHYRNSIHCIKVIYLEEGFWGFYKGFGANAFSKIGSSLVLVLYDEFQKLVGVIARGSS